MENTTPQTLLETIRYFSDQDTCLQFLIPLRWPNGIKCPRCQSDKHSFLSTRRLWKCKGCKKQFSIKVGTIFEDSPLGLDKWLAAIWLIANAKNGVSSWEVHRALGVTQKSAWFMLHRIRLAMQTGTFEKLQGTVEADETFVGGKAANMHKSKHAAAPSRRGTSGKTIVMGLLERHGKVVTKVIPNTKRRTVQSEVRQHVAQGAEVFTDALPSYDGLSAEYVHEVIDHAEAYVHGRVHTNGLENFWSLLKRMVKGTYVSVTPAHLFRYLDEESFRFNQRKENDGTRFVEVLSGIADKRLTYANLVG
jgi:transposase-like protein